MVWFFIATLLWSNTALFSMELKQLSSDELNNVARLFAQYETSKSLEKELVGVAKKNVCAIKNLDDFNECTDVDGNGLLHHLALLDPFPYAVIQYLIFYKKFSVLKKNNEKQDPWLYSYSVRKKEQRSISPLFNSFLYLYRGISASQQIVVDEALCNKKFTNSNDIKNKDQRGGSLLYYVAASGRDDQTRRLLQLNMLDHETEYCHLLRSLFYYAEYAARFNEEKRHGQVVDAIISIIKHDTERLAPYARGLSGQAFRASEKFVSIFYAVDNFSVLSASIEEYLKSIYEENNSSLRNQIIKKSLDEIFLLSGKWAE